MIMYVGDLHGDVDAYAAMDREAIKNNISIIVQVGDSGVLWDGGCPVEKYFKKRDRQGRKGPDWYTCGGNHENWDVWQKLENEQTHKVVEIAPGFHWVTRAHTIELDGKSHLFFGGAESTDKHLRIEGVSWWKYETPTAGEFSDFFDAFDSGRPDVVVAHEAPLCVDLNRVGRDSQVTPRNLQNVITLSDHRPSFYFFGHHHILKEWKIDGVSFWCCGIGGEYVAR